MGLSGAQATEHTEPDTFWKPTAPPSPRASRAKQESFPRRLAHVPLCRSATDSTLSVGSVRRKGGNLHPSEG